MLYKHAFYFKGNAAAQKYLNEQKCMPGKFIGITPSGRGPDIYYVGYTTVDRIEDGQKLFEELSRFGCISCYCNEEVYL